MRKTIIQCDCCGGTIHNEDEVCRLDLFINARVETPEETQARVSRGGFVQSERPQIICEGNIASLVTPKRQTKDYCLGCKTVLIEAVIEAFDKKADECRAEAARR